MRTRPRVVLLQAGRRPHTDSRRRPARRAHHQRVPAPGGRRLSSPTATRPDTATANGHKPAPKRVPPHNLQAEQSLIGALLLSKEARDATVSLVTDEHFYVPAHGHIYDVIARLHDAGEPVDITTVADRLHHADLLDTIGGRQHLETLAAETPATTSAARYAHIVEEHATLRRLIALAGQITDQAYNLPDDLTGIRRHAEAALELLDRATTTTGARPFVDVLHDWLDEIDRRALGERTAVPTGFIDLDKVLGGGLRGGQLIVISGRTSMGKTAVAGSLVLNAAAVGVPALVCSIEMAELELADRYVSATSRVSLEQIRSGTIAPRDWDHINRHLPELAARPIWIDDRDELTVAHIRGLARSLPTPPGLIVVDYLQLLRPSQRGENRQSEVAELSASLKRLARRLDVPIVALAQLNRGSESRHDKRPQLTDLRESGSIENDADVVIGLYRDDYYHADSKDVGVLEAIVMKQRSGPLKTVRLAFTAATSAVLNLSTQQEM